MTTYINTANAMSIIFRKLECIPEIEYYDFGLPYYTEAWNNLNKDKSVDGHKKLWEEHGLVYETDDYVVAYDKNVIPFEEIKYYEHFCDVYDGIYTKIRNRQIVTPDGSSPIGRVEEQIQLFQGGKMVLDSKNRYGCYNFSYTHCNQFYFGVPSIVLSYGTLYIKSAASHVEFSRYYDKVKNESDRSWIEAWEGGCKALHLTISVSAYNADYIENKYITFPHTDEVVHFPLTTDKLKRIMYLEYTSPSPRYGEIVDKNTFESSTDKCHFNIELH